MIIAGIVFLVIAFLAWLSTFSYGGFIGESFTGFIVILGIGIALLFFIRLNRAF